MHTFQDERSDAELHRCLVAGDRRPGATIYQRHLQRVRSACRAVLGDDGLAEDVAQEVFMEFLARPERAKLDRSPLSAYLSLMGRRRAVDAVRSRERAKRREQLATELASTGGYGPAQGVEASVVGLDVWRAVHALPPTQRAVVHRAFGADRTYREAAAELGISEGTAKSRMRSALTRLRVEPGLAEAA